MELNTKYIMTQIEIEYKREVKYSTTVNVPDDVAQRLLNLPDDEGNVERDEQMAEVEEWCDDPVDYSPEITGITITKVTD